MARRTTEPKDKLLPKLTSFFFDRPILTLVLWALILGFGILSYTTLMRREGFPTITVPIAIVDGTSASDNAGELDSKVTQPIAKLATAQSDVNTVVSQTAGNFYSVVIQFKDGVDAK